MPLHKVTCMPRGHALGVVSTAACIRSFHVGKAPNQTNQTQRLPKDDRHSVSWKEYMADIDVSLGGRVAEELGELTHSAVAQPLV